MLIDIDINMTNVLENKGSIKQIRTFYNSLIWAAKLVLT